MTEGSQPVLAGISPDRGLFTDHSELQARFKGGARVVFETKLMANFNLTYSAC